MWDFLWVFLAVAVYKLVSNLVYWGQCGYYRTRFTEFCNGKEDCGIFRTKSPVKKLIINAIGESYWLTEYPDCKTYLQKDVVIMFEEAIGEYKSRCLEVFSPLYWINTVIYLPQKILQYIGLPSETWIGRILNAIWWISVAIYTVNKEMLKGLLLWAAQKM